MTDESIDIHVHVAVLKQLVLVGQYLTDSGVKTSFLHIGDIISGTAETIERAILCSTCVTKPFRLQSCVLLVVMVCQ